MLPKTIQNQMRKINQIFNLKAEILPHGQSGGISSFCSELAGPVIKFSSSDFIKVRLSIGGSKE